MFTTTTKGILIATAATVFATACGSHGSGSGVGEKVSRTSEALGSPCLTPGVATNMAQLVGGFSPSTGDQIVGIPLGKTPFGLFYHTAIAGSFCPSYQTTITLTGSTYALTTCQLPPQYFTNNGNNSCAPSGAPTDTLGKDYITTSGTNLVVNHLNGWSETYLGPSGGPWTFSSVEDTKGKVRMILTPNSDGSISVYNQWNKVVYTIGPVTTGTNIPSYIKDADGITTTIPASLAGSVQKLGTVSWPADADLTATRTMVPTYDSSNRLAGFWFDTGEGVTFTNNSDNSFAAIASGVGTPSAGLTTTRYKTAYTYNAGCTVTKQDYVGSTLDTTEKISMAPTGATQGFVTSVSDEFSLTDNATPDNNGVYTSGTDYGPSTSGWPWSRPSAPGTPDFPASFTDGTTSESYTYNGPCGLPDTSTDNISGVNTTLTWQPNTGAGYYLALATTKASSGATIAVYSAAPTTDGCDNIYSEASASADGNESYHYTYGNTLTGVACFYNSVQTRDMVTGDVVTVTTDAFDHLTSYQLNDKTWLYNFTPGGEPAGTTLTFPDGSTEKVLGSSFPGGAPSGMGVFGPAGNMLNQVTLKNITIGSTTSGTVATQVNGGNAAQVTPTIVNGNATQVARVTPAGGTPPIDKVSVSP